MNRLARSQFLAVVKENTPLCRDHYRLTLALKAFPVSEPGQFVQLLCRPPEGACEDSELEWEAGGRVNLHDPDLVRARAMLRRPFSLAGRRDGVAAVELDIIHRVVGVGTQWLASLKLGDTVSVLGPLGNRFELPAPGVTALLVAGGVGIPPMLYLGEKLKGRAIAFCGATTRDLLPFHLMEEAKGSDPSIPAHRAAEFQRFSIPCVLTTDDGSYGLGGFVTEALERYLDGWASDPSNLAIYTCGPELMMRRVGEIALGRGIACQVAVERAMACGMGTCQSCCIKVAQADGWQYKLACTDGPIFEAGALLW